VRDLVTLGQADLGMLATFVAGYIEPRRRLVEQVLARAIANGEFDPGIDFASTVDTLYGPLFLRLIVTHDTLDDAFVSRHVDTVLRGLAPRNR